LRRLIVVVLVIVLVVSSVFASIYFLDIAQSPAYLKAGFHVGVSFCGNTTAEAKLLVDRVKTYTNLFVIQSGPVSTNETAMNEIMNYAVGANLDVIVFFGYFYPNITWQIPWLDYAKQQWGDKFLGIYLNDEPAGQTLDANWNSYFIQQKIRNSSAYYTHVPEINLQLNGTLPPDNTEASLHFLDAVKTSLGLDQLQSRQIHSFTSDYVLYWFDLKGGYDTIFAEFGSNASVAQNIALDRGAARLQNKTWGTIITWIYDQPPYIVNGTEMYNQLVTAYQSGAKYAVIFDYPQIDDNPYGILTDQHFAELERFWNKIQTLPPNESAEAVLVLPHDYGWGMRTPQEPVWGLWAPDNTSGQIWNITQELLGQFGTGLDIVYEDAQFPVVGQGYQQIYYWNQTVL
jgi:hypothetical protein